MKGPTIETSREVQSIILKPENFIAIFLHTNEKKIDIEIRITPEGKAEIFCSDDSLGIMSFKEWKSCD
jgi:hypothetical protein